MSENPMLDIYRDQNAVLEHTIHRLRQENEELTARNNQYTRLLAIAVQRLGQRLVVIDDDVPCLLINGNVVETRAVVRVYPAVEGTHLGMGDE